MKVLRVLLVCMLAMTPLSLMASAGAASGGELGTLLIKGVGSVYSGPEALAALVTTAGSTSTIAMEVKNTGTTIAQYNVRTSGFTSIGCTPTCAPANYTLSEGSTNITAASSGSNGYYTSPIAPGAVAAYTLRIVLPSSAKVDNYSAVRVSLSDLAGNSLGWDEGAAEVKATTGTTNHDQFVAGSGQSTLSSPEPVGSAEPVVTDAPVAVGQKATFTAKLQNDSATASPILYRLPLMSSCASDFGVKVTESGSGITATSTDITSSATGSGWITPALAHGASVTVTVTIEYLGGARACLRTGYAGWSSTAGDTAGHSASAFLSLPFAAGSN